MVTVRVSVGDRWSDSFGQRCISGEPQAWPLRTLLLAPGDRIRLRQLPGARAPVVSKGRHELRGHSFITDGRCGVMS